MFEVIVPGWGVYYYITVSGNQDQMEKVPVPGIL
jgi:hypothetical protein